MSRDFKIFLETVVVLIVSTLLGAAWGFYNAFYIFASAMSGSKPGLVLEYTFLLPILPITKLNYPLELVYISGPIFVLLIYLSIRFLFKLILHYR